MATSEPSAEDTAAVTDFAELAASFATATPDELAEAVVELHSAMVAIEARFLAALGAFGATDAYRDDGARDLADWLCFRLGCAHRRAKSWTKAAERLVDHPGMGDLAAKGALSFDQLEHLLVLAEVPGMDEEALEREGPLASAAELARAVQAERATEEDDVAQAARTRHLRFVNTGAATRLSGSLPGDEAALLEAALWRLAERDGNDHEPDGSWTSRPAQLADALCSLAKAACPKDVEAPLPLVVCHVDAAALCGEERAPGELATGERLCGETLRRLACDAKLALVVEDDTGAPLHLGRTRRQAPPWLTRQLRYRDKGCRFPGCGRNRFLHAHHLVHWAEGGPTDPDNLVMLCPHHHRFVHEHHWRLTRSDTGTLVAIDPSGRRLEHMPPLLSKQVAARLFGPPQPVPGTESTPERE